VQKMLLMALLTASVLCSLQQGGSSAVEDKTGAAVAASAAPEGVIKVTITTGGGMYGPVKSQFKVGEDVPVVITMTNTGDKPAKFCLSTSVFQNRPQLKRDGQLVPYLSNLPEQTDQEDIIQRCERSASRQFYELLPRQTKVVDWFKISLQGIAWYGALTPGHYELSLMRRIGCCQGPLVKSNKAAFEVVP
jgi:hypothetical protein